VAITTRILSLVHELCTKRIHVTKRDLFYTDVKLFEDQGQSDAILDDLSCMLGCTRWAPGWPGWRCLGRCRPVLQAGMHAVGAGLIRAGWPGCWGSASCPLWRPALGPPASLTDVRLAMRVAGHGAQAAAGHCCARSAVSSVSRAAKPGG
jgi:hypothetical protein